MLKSNLVAWISASLFAPLCAQQTQEAVTFFENEIRPILRSNCQQCHNAQNRTSGLSLASRESLLAGGNRGSAVKPGHSAESLLVRAVEQAGDLKMPPGGKLPPAQVATIRR